MNKRTSSNDRNQLSSCEGKIQLSAKDAKRAAKRMKMAPYKCNHCDWWHVGSTNVKLLDKRARFDKMNDLER